MARIGTLALVVFITLYYAAFPSPLPLSNKGLAVQIDSAKGVVEHVDTVLQEEVVHVHAVAGLFGQQLGLGQRRNEAVRVLISVHRGPHRFCPDGGGLSEHGDPAHT